MAEKKLGFATIAVHGKKKMGKHDTGPPIRALSTPIFLSSTFAFKNADEGAAIFAGRQAPGTGRMRNHSISRRAMLSVPGNSRGKPSGSNQSAATISRWSMQISPCRDSTVNATISDPLKGQGWLPK